MNSSWASSEKKYNCSCFDDEDLALPEGCFAPELHLVTILFKEESKGGGGDVGRDAHACKKMQSEAATTSFAYLNEIN